MEIVFSQDYGRSFTAYSKKSAINIKDSFNQRNVATLTIDSCNLVNSKPDWQNRSNKISIQLTQIELINMANYILGYSESCSGNYHGTEKNKSFQVHDNGLSGIIINSHQAGRTISGVIPTEGRQLLITMVFGRLAFGWGVSVADAIGLLKIDFARKRAIAATKAEGYSHPQQGHH